MIYIVIPVFNRKKFTYNCIKSLQQQTFKNFKIILVDDGSTDGTEELISKEFPDVIILKGDGNLWWTGATNLGVQYVLDNSKDVANDFLLTLNNDLVVNNHYLNNMYEFVKDNPKSIIGSVSIDYSNPEKIDFCGVRWNQLIAKQRAVAKDFNYSFKALKQYGKKIETDFLPGRGTLIPLELFKKIGLYDSRNFPHYAADDDFSLRAKKNGYHLLIIPHVVVQSHINETGTNLEKKTLSIKYFKDLFFSIKSPLNLKIRYRWAMKNTTYKIIYFGIDVSRILFSLSRKILIRRQKI